MRELRQSASLSGHGGKNSIANADIDMRRFVEGLSQARLALNDDQARQLLAFLEEQLAHPGDAVSCCTQHALCWTLLVLRHDGMLPQCVDKVFEQHRCTRPLPLRCTLSRVATGQQELVQQRCCRMQPRPQQNSLRLGITTASCPGAPAND